MEVFFLQIVSRKSTRFELKTSDLKKDEEEEEKDENLTGKEVTNSSNFKTFERFLLSFSILLAMTSFK